MFLKLFVQILILNLNLKKKADLVSAISDAARTFGLEAFFTYFEVDLLQDVAEDLKLNHRKTSNKRKLVDCIIYQKDVEKQPKVKKARVEASKKKKLLKKELLLKIFFNIIMLTKYVIGVVNMNLRQVVKKEILLNVFLLFLMVMKKQLKLDKRRKREEKKLKLLQLKKLLLLLQQVKVEVEVEAKKLQIKKKRKKMTKLKKKRKRE